MSKAIRSQPLRAHSPPDTTSYGAQTFKLSSTTPANKATGIAVTSPVTFTMTNLIDAASVNNQSVAVEVCLDGADCNNVEAVAGTYSVNDAAVTFTPLTPYPPSTVIGMAVGGLMDEAGNLALPTQIWLVHDRKHRGHNAAER